ncbi:hypothetical protein ES703_78578 [subsurface metagenome]
MCGSGAGTGMEVITIQVLLHLTQPGLLRETTGWCGAAASTVLRRAAV